MELINFINTDPDEHGYWSVGCGELFMFGKVLVGIYGFLEFDFRWS
jgi:hypothetical protein